MSIGDEVEVEVINVDREAKRIGLSRRRVIRDPWDEIATSVRRGQLIRGRVTKLTKFGAFARLIDHDSVEGLIHISELSGERVDHPREVVNRGDELVLRIIKIDIKDRRLGLSLKSVQSTEYLDLDWGNGDSGRGQPAARGNRSRAGPAIRSGAPKNSPLSFCRRQAICRAGPAPLGSFAVSYTPKSASPHRCAPSAFRAPRVQAKGTGPPR